MLIFSVVTGKVVRITRQASSFIVFFVCTNTRLRNELYLSNPNSYNTLEYIHRFRI